MSVQTNNVPSFLVLSFIAKASSDFIPKTNTSSLPSTNPNVKMSSDDSSELSSVPSEDDSTLQLTKKDGILKFFSKAPPPAASKAKEASPPRPKREPSPPHEYVLADNPDIAVCI
jgi:hypothetical protein